MVISNGPPAGPLLRATSQRPSPSAVAAAFSSRKVTVTFSPLSAVPQIFTFAFCCRTMPSLHSACGLTSARADTGNKPMQRMKSKIRIFMYVSFSQSRRRFFDSTADMMPDRREKINERVKKIAPSGSRCLRDPLPPGDHDRAGEIEYMAKRRRNRGSVYARLRLREQLARLEDAALQHRQQARTIFENRDVGQHVAVHDQHVAELAGF